MASPNRYGVRGPRPFTTFDHKPHLKGENAACGNIPGFVRCWCRCHAEDAEDTRTRFCGKSVRVTDIAMAVADAALYNRVVARKLTAQLTREKGSNRISGCSSRNSHNIGRSSDSRLASGSTKSGNTCLNRNTRRIAGHGTEEIGDVSCRTIRHGGEGYEAANIGTSTGGPQGVNTGVSGSSNRPRHCAGPWRRLLPWLSVSSVQKMEEKTKNKETGFPLRNPAMPRSKVRFPEDRKSLCHIIPMCNAYIFTTLFLYITFLLTFVVAPALVLLFHTVRATFPAEAPPETTALIYAPEKCDAIMLSPEDLPPTLQPSQHRVAGGTVAAKSVCTPGHQHRSGCNGGTTWFSSSGTCYSRARSSSSSSNSRTAPHSSGSTEVTWQSLLLLSIGVGSHIWVLRYYLLHLITKRVWPGYVERQFLVDRLLFEEESYQYFSPARPISPLCGRYGFTELNSTDPVILALISPISGGKLAMVYYQELVLPELYLLFGSRTHVVPVILEETVAHMLCAFLQKWSFVFDFALILGGDGAFHTIVNLLTKISMEELVVKDRRGIFASRSFHATPRQAPLFRRKINSFPAPVYASSATSGDAATEHVSTSFSSKTECQRLPSAHRHTEPSQRGRGGTQRQSPTNCCCACWEKNNFYPLDLVISPVPLGTSNTWCSEFVFSHAGPIAARFYAAMARKDAARCVAQVEGGLAEDSETAAAHAAMAEATEEVARTAAAAAAAMTAARVASSTGVATPEASAAQPTVTRMESRTDKGAQASSALAVVPHSPVGCAAVSQASPTQMEDIRTAEARKTNGHTPTSYDTKDAGVFPAEQRLSTATIPPNPGSDGWEDRRASGESLLGGFDVLSVSTADPNGYSGKLHITAQEGNELAATAEGRETPETEKQTERQNACGTKPTPAEALAFQRTAYHTTAEGNSVGLRMEQTTVTKKGTSQAKEATGAEEVDRLTTEYSVAGDLQTSADVGTGTAYGQMTHGDGALANTATVLQAGTKAVKLHTELKDTVTHYLEIKHTSSSALERSEKEKRQSIVACAAASAALEDVSVAQEMAARAALRQAQTGTDMNAGAATLLGWGCAAVEAEKTAAAAMAAALEVGGAAEEVGMLLGEGLASIPDEGHASSVLQHERDALLYRATPTIGMKPAADFAGGEPAETLSGANAATPSPCGEAAARPVASAVGGNAVDAAADIVALLAAEAGDNKKAFARLRQDSQLLRPDAASAKQMMLRRAKYFLRQAERLDELALQIGAGKDKDMTKMGREKLLHFWLRRIRECRSTRINALLVEANGERHICCNSLEFGFIGTAQVHSEDLRWLGHMRYTGAFLYHLITMGKFYAYIEAVLPNGKVVHKIGEYMVIALDIIQHWTDDRPVARQAQMDGPCAWLLLLSGKISRARLLSYMMDLRRLSVAVDQGLEMIPVKKVTVKLNEPGIFGLDGEVYRHDGELKFTLLPGFTRMCVSEFDQMVAQPAVGHRWMKYMRSE